MYKIRHHLILRDSLVVTEVMANSLVPFFRPIFTLLYDNMHLFGRRYSMANDFAAMPGDECFTFVWRSRCVDMHIFIS